MGTARTAMMKLLLRRYHRTEVRQVNFLLRAYRKNLICVSNFLRSLRKIDSSSSTENADNFCRRSKILVIRSASYLTTLSALASTLGGIVGSVEGIAA